MDADNVLATGKGGYVSDKEFDRRTAEALSDNTGLFHRDAVDTRVFREKRQSVVQKVFARFKQYRLLDLGCGYGQFAPLLAGKNCTEYVGVERVEARVKYAREHYGTARRRFVLGDIRTFRTDDRFDIVWSQTVLQHLVHGDKVRMIETAKAARAHGGVILMCEGEIRDEPVDVLAQHYRDDGHVWHMIPMAFQQFVDAMAPLVVTRLSGLFFLASEGGE